MQGKIHFHTEILGMHRNTTGALSANVVRVLSTVSLVIALSFLAQPTQAQMYNVLYNFTYPISNGTPYTGVILNNGNLFGTAAWGGIQGAGCCGAAFELTNNGSGWVYSTLHFFGLRDGWGPSSITFGPDGNIYGATFGGPIAASVFGDRCYGVGCGTVFQLQAPGSNGSSWSETILADFHGPDGAYPAGDLPFDTAGNFYGAASSDSEEGNLLGVVYEMTPTPNGWTKTVIYQFINYINGGAVSGMVIDPSGSLYGAAGEGGSSGYGYVFQLVPSANGWTANVLHWFEGDMNGGWPINGLVRDNSGNLYGTTLFGGSNGLGVVYELSATDTGWVITPLYSFGDRYASDESKEVSIDAAGNLYGYDNRSDGSILFKLTPGENGWNYAALHQFTCDTGCSPAGKVAIDANGTVYGMTVTGGTLGNGVVFEVTQ